MIGCHIGEEIFTTNIFLYYILDKYRMPSPFTLKAFRVICYIIEQKYSIEKNRQIVNEKIKKMK